MKRLWFVVNRRGQMHCEELTDERALARLERGDDLRPVGDRDELIAELLDSLDSTT